MRTSPWSFAIARCAVLSIVLGGFVSAHASSPAVVRGSATYRERIALPADAVFEATLEDVSRADEPATVIGRVMWRSPGQVPIRFEIPYAPLIVKKNRRYVVRARITANERLLFTTDRAYPVLGSEAGTRADVLLRRVREGGPGGPDRGDDDDDSGRPRHRGVAAAPLENTYWRLVRLGDRAVPMGSGERRAPHVVLEPKEHRVHGSGGCNTIGGPYTLDGQRLRFGPLVTTRIACIEGMETEGRFFTMLDQARAWRVTAEQLDLFDASGNALARFERYLE